MDENIQVKEIKDLIDDYNKCDFYLNNLKNGNIHYLNEAIAFANKKYKEFCFKDTEVALKNTNFIPTNLDELSQTKQNLIAINKMIDEVLLKKINEENKQ